MYPALRSRPCAAPGGRLGPRALTFGQWFTLLISACLVPATVAVAVLILSLYYQGRNSVEAATLHTARALMQAFDQELSRVEGMVVALSTSPSLERGDLRLFASQVAQLLPYGPETNFVLWNRNGTQLINGRYARESADRAFTLPRSVRQVFDTGRPAVSDLYIGPLTRHYLASVDVPVSLHGGTDYVLSGQIFSEQLQRILVRQKIPPDWVVAVLDSRGIVVARTRDADKFIGKPATAGLRERIAGASEGVFPDSTLEGVPSIAIFSVSTVSRWAVVIGVHRDAHTDSLWTAIRWLGLGVVLLFALGLGLAQLIGARIAASVRGLVAPAVALGEGKPLKLPTFHLREANEAGQAMLQAWDLLRRRTAERDQAAQAEQQAREGRQAVERSEAFLRGVFEESPDAVLLVAPDGALVRANAEAEHMFAYPQGALTALTVDDVLRDPAAGAMLGKALAGYRRRERFTLQARRSDGTVFPVDMMLSSLTGSAQRLTIATIRDVTEREQKDAALRESEMRFRNTLEHAPIGIATLSLDGRWIEENAAVSRIVGYDKSALCGMRIGDVLHPADLGLGMDQFKRLVDGGEGVNQTELRFCHQDGHPVPVLLTCTLLRDDAGAPRHFIVQVQDITERKRAESELTTLNKRLGLATRAGGIAVWDWDLLTDFVLWDEHMYKLYQIAPGPDGISLSRWAACIHPEDRQRIEDEAGQAARAGSECATEFRIVWPGGEVRNLRASAIVSRAPDGTALHMTGVNIDVTDHRRKEAAISSALREKETLLKELYHRVKNNLQLITSLFNLQARTLPPGGARTALSEGAGRVQAMALVHEKLYQSGKLSSIMLDTYVGELCVQLGVTASASTRGIALVAEVEPIEIGLELAVPVGLLLNELISNSLKHAFPDERPGRIVVQITMNDAGRVTLRVSDDGVGFPPDLDQTCSRALGLKLVAALSRQLGAEGYAPQNRNGATVTVEFEIGTGKPTAPPQGEQDVQQRYQSA